MTYPFVQSYTDLGLRQGPVLAFVIHMAEGGGTVSYLSKQNPNGVSVHYVIERTGRIVQMLRESHMHSSIRTTAIRLTDDADGFFGRTAAVAVMGKWADTAHTLGPNHASIAVEIEGFAASGPNADQAAALVKLVADLRTRYPSIGLLGHRDFASYKACPGRFIPWAALGGHGPASEAIVAGPVILNPQPIAGLATIKRDGKAHAAIQVNDGVLVWLAAGDRKNIIAKGTLATPWPGHPSGTVYLVGDEWAVLLHEDVDLDLLPPCSTQIASAVDAAVAVTKASARVVFE